MKKRIYILFIAVLAVAFAASTVYLLKNISEDKKEMNAIAVIQKEIENSDSIFNKYAKFHSENSDFAGWIEIDSTNIDYPVMQSKSNGNFYLNHNFNKKYSRFGLPYIDERCNVDESENIIIYGHNMKTNDMFSALTLFENGEFCTCNKYIFFNTLNEMRIYEIVCVLKTTAYTNSSFRYYDYTDFCNEKDFNEFIDKCSSLSLYFNTDVEYGDRLITLSTCEYSKRNGRLAVIGKLVKTEYEEEY